MLRDRLVTDVADLVSPDPDVVLIDEADSVLVDEALVPLVLAGPPPRTPRLEIIRDRRRAAPRLHYEMDDEGRNVHLTDAGARWRRRRSAASTCTPRSTSAAR